MVRPVPEVARDTSVTAALEALAAGDARRAESVCRESLARAPESIDHLRLLGRALLAQSRLEEAEQALRQALELQPGLAQAHEELGGVLALQRRFEEAVGSLEAALRLDPGLPFAGKKLGQALAALGRAAEADAVLESWLGRSQDRASVVVALDHLQAGRQEDAIATLKARLRINPDNVDALVTLAQAWLGDNQHAPDVEALLRRATDIAPAHVGAWLLLGSALHGSDRPEQAIAAYQRATGLEPENAGAWSGLGAEYALIGDMEKSTAAYGRSVSLRPGLPGIHLSYAHSLKALGRRAESLHQ